MESLEERRLLAIDFLPGDMPIDASVGMQKHVAVEKGPNGYLAVWTDERSVLSGMVNTTSPISGSMQDIYGQLLDLDGNPVGAPIIVSNMGQNQLTPKLAWNESAQAWLVVFESQDPDWCFDHHIYGVRVGADGTVLDSDPILIFQQDGNQGISNPDVASDGTHWSIIADSFYGEPLVGAIFTGVGAWSSGDFNADGFVDGSDFNIWNSHKFTSMFDRRQSFAFPTRLAAVDAWFRQEELKRDSARESVDFAELGNRTRHDRIESELLASRVFATAF